MKPVYFVPNGGETLGEDLETESLALATKRANEVGTSVYVLLGSEGAEEPPIVRWKMEVGEREAKMIRDCLGYDDDPSGLPGGALMQLVARLARIVQMQQMRIHGLGLEIRSLKQQAVNPFLFVPIIKEPPKAPEMVMKTRHEIPSGTLRYYQDPDFITGSSFFRKVYPPAEENEGS